MAEEERRLIISYEQRTQHVIGIVVYDRVLCRDRLRADDVNEEQFSFMQIFIRPPLTGEATRKGNQ